MATQDPVLSVRLPGDLDARIDKCAKKLDLSKNDIARHAIRAAVDAIEANGYRIEVPLEMVIKKKAAPVESRPARGAFGAIDDLKRQVEGATVPTAAARPSSSTTLYTAEEIASPKLNESAPAPRRGRGKS